MWAPASIVFSEERGENRFFEKERPVFVPFSSGRKGGECLLPSLCRLRKERKKGRIGTPPLLLPV